MRRTVIATLAMVLTVLAWTAPARAQVSAGLAAGATYSEMGGRLITATDSDWGILLGGYARYRMQSNLAFQLEANWAQKGGRGTVQGDRVDFDLGYVELPLTAQLVVGLGEQWDWNLYGGIAFAFKAGCGVSDGQGEEASCDAAAPNWDFAGTEWSVPFGTSFSYLLPRSILTVDFRYSYGLSAAIEDLDLKNRSWQLIFRWGFEV